jgi:hypothetical protein
MDRAEFEEMARRTRDHGAHPLSPDEQYEALEYALARIERLELDLSAELLRTRWSLLLQRIKADLDRCQHGRRSFDECYGCRDSEFHTTFAAGNPHLMSPIGYHCSGTPWTVADLIEALR